MSLQSRLHERQGSLLIDALLSIVIFAIIVAAFSSGISGGQEGTMRSGNRMRAIYLAEEGLEAVRSIRDAANGFATLAARPLNQDDGVQLTGSTWTITENPTTIDGFFTRRITFASGINSATLKVTATVSWTEQPKNQALEIALVTYLTNWHTPPPPPPPNWSQPIVKGSVRYNANANLGAATLKDVVVQGNYAYAANASDADKGLIIYNVSSITNPSFSAAIGVAAANDLAISGNYLYLGTEQSSSELKILDISDPLHVTCCVNEINLQGSSAIYGVFITGTGLYLSRDTPGPELYVYDIGDNPTSPTLLARIETNPDHRNIHAVTATGQNIFSSSARPFAYVASDYTTQELTVLSVTGAAITGGGDAPGGSAQLGRSVAVFNTGAFVGVAGDGLCEVFAFDIAGKIGNPNAAPNCGSNASYDLGGSSDASDSANDMEVSKNLGRLFIATHTVRGNLRHYLHILDIRNVLDIGSANRKIYDGAITDGYETDSGLFYRESDHTIFMVGGSEENVGSDLLILQPTFTYD